MYFIILGYLLIINIAGFASMGLDKQKAINNEYRISEKALFTIALLGGGIGSTIGMHHFRHKTKHWYFKYGFPAILVIQIVLIGIVIGMMKITVVCT